MSIFSRRRVFAINRWLYHFALKGMGFDNWQSMDLSGEQWAINELLPPLLESSSPLMLDVGAHHGEYSVEFQSRFPDARIHAFEPHPKTFRLLKQKAPVGVHLHHCAVGATEGTAQLFDREASVSSGTVHASLSKASVESTGSDELVAHDVNVTTIDDFLETNGLTTVDFLKIDTEGHEMDVLRGASNALSGGRLGIIQFEFNTLHVAQKCFLADFMSLLHGHRLYRLLADGMIALDLLRVSEREVFAFQNIVAIPLDRAPKVT